MKRQVMSQAMRLFEVDKVFAFEVVRGHGWGRPLELAIYTSEPPSDEERAEVERRCPDDVQFLYRLHPDAQRNRRWLN